jgi:hypothetical protein
MVVEKLGSGDIKEIEDVPADYNGCMYCYAASKTCKFFQVGDTHFLRVEGELREVACMQKHNGAIALSCHPITEAEAKKLISKYRAYN